jgi:hypothetical protein
MSQQATETQKQSPEPPRKPGSEQKRLNVFVGKWKTEGQQHEGLVGPAAKITAVETYEWLTGEFFLIHRFEGRVGEGEAACIEITGYDAKRQCYAMHTFYNSGIANEWRLDECDCVWMLTGDWQMSGELMKVRCKIEFGDAGNTMRGKWEHSSDGSSWQTFWDVKAEKIK